MGESTGLVVRVLGAVPSLAAAGTLIWAVARRRGAVLRRLGRLGPPTAVCAALSLISGVALPKDGLQLRSGSDWKLVEVAVLLLLLAVVNRWSPPRELT